VFTRLTHEIATAQAVEQHEFDRHTRAAADATDPERRLVLVGTAGAILLAGGGLYRRLREYRS
jgi:hypothetical protein